MTSIPKKAGIYKFTNRINGKVYIGKSVNLYNRIQSHKHLKPRYAFDFALKKYGWQNFDIEILHWYENIPVDNNELIALETSFIEAYDSLINKNGYNVCLFGNEIKGIKRSEETKRKLAQAKIGSKNPNFGKLVFYRPKGAFLGINNPNFDNKTYIFKNLKTGEIFSGNRYEFRKKYNLSRNVDAMIRGIDKSVKGWTLI